MSEWIYFFYILAWVEERKKINLFNFKADEKKLNRFGGSLNIIIYEKFPLHFLVSFADYLHQISIPKFCPYIPLITPITYCPVCI